ncbi:MAG: hypothetical protein V2I32_00330 [Desulforhopalus sp.]|jgi:hypothetical protein|nr:hypothetical protein [Desulforhopalus sp.]
MMNVQLFGAGCFGAIIGWYVYYINRYRKSDIQLGDLVTVIGVIGGSAVLALFPAGTALFGAYGIGLAIGFFGYFLVLIILVGVSGNFDADWYLDGRRKLPDGTVFVPQVGTPAAGGTAMAPKEPSTGGMR